MAYHVQWGPGVRAQLEAAPAEVRKQFDTLLRALVEHPRPGEAVLGVLPLTEGADDDVFTAPFDDALLVYRILPWAVRGIGSHRAWDSDAFAIGVTSWGRARRARGRAAR